MHRRSETRAGNHQRHTRTRHASLPTQAKHTARGARKQPPNQGAIHAASEQVNSQLMRCSCLRASWTPNIATLENTGSTHSAAFYHTIESWKHSSILQGEQINLLPTTVHCSAPLPPNVELHAPDTVNHFSNAHDDTPVLCSGGPLS